jgi:hypothetical protein
MAHIALSPKARRFLDEATKSAPIESAEFRDKIAPIDAWKRTLGLRKLGSRDIVAVPFDVVEAFLVLINFITDYAARGHQFLDWDENDIMFIQCVADGIRADPRLQPAAAL